MENGIKSDLLLYLSFPRPFLFSSVPFCFPASLLSFPLSFCHSRADGNLEKKSQQNTNTENFYFEKTGFPPSRE
jgi:hypothetical protein